MIIGDILGKLKSAETIASELTNNELMDREVETRLIILRGADVSKLVPSATLEYIAARGIYHVTAEHGTGA